MHRSLTLKAALFLLASGLAASAMAQGAASGVQESTDPARAAAVEKAVAELKARAAQGAASSPDSPSVAPVLGKTDAGVAFLSGGITVEDRTSMYAERGRYTIWVATVARPSGAYLVDARLRIVDLKDRRTVLERTMEGPWLFAALPAGLYDISATYRADGADTDQTLTERVRVAGAGQRQVVLRFKSSDEVSTEMDSPFKGNPFGDPTKPR